MNARKIPKLADVSNKNHCYLIKVIVSVLVIKIKQPTEN